MSEAIVSSPAEDPFHYYMQHGFHNIEGWPGRTDSVLFMKHFRSLFRKHGETGGVCEIGVHHGRYIIALHNVLCTGRSLGIDLFDEQDKNIDNSGCGSKEKCRENILKYAHHPDSIELISKDSLAFTDKELQQITKTHGLFSMFSVDGGHTALHLSVDFLTASKLTSSRGMIIIDDLFHPDWPGVTEGIIGVLSTRISPFVPLFMTRKKLYLSHVSYHETYKQFVADAYLQYASANNFLPWMKPVDFVNWKIPSISFGAEY